MPDTKAIQGHREAIGETIAKMQFLEHGWNSYSGLLDEDKVDLLLRRKIHEAIRYVEVQVKGGRLHLPPAKWTRAIYDVTSWRLFDPTEFDLGNQGLVIAYVLFHETHSGALNEIRFQGDIFLFTKQRFSDLLRKGIPSRGRVSIWIARKKGTELWYLWRHNPTRQTADMFRNDSNDFVIDVTACRQNFSILDAAAA